MVQGGSVFSDGTDNYLQCTIVYIDCSALISFDNQVLHSSVSVPESDASF